MRATVEGLARHLPLARAVSFATRIPDAATQVTVLRQLLSIGSIGFAHRDELDTVAVEAAREWREPSVHALIEMADHLEGARRYAVLQRALGARLRPPRREPNARIRSSRSAGRSLLG